MWGVRERKWRKNEFSSLAGLSDGVTCRQNGLRMALKSGGAWDLTLSPPFEVIFGFSYHSFSGNRSTSLTRLALNKRMHFQCRLTS